MRLSRVSPVVRVGVLLFVFAVIAGANIAPVGHAERAPSLEGAWKIVETQNPNAAANTKPFPGLYVFTKQHYAFVNVTGTEPRKKNPAVAPAAQLSDAEKIARYEEWRAFSANIGTYQVQGTTLTTRPVAAKNEGVMGSTNVFDVTTDGKTLTLVAKSGSGYGANGTRTKLVRVE